MTCAGQAAALQSKLDLSTTVWPAVHNCGPIGGIGKSDVCLATALAHAHHSISVHVCCVFAAAHVDGRLLSSQASKRLAASMQNRSCIVGDELGVLRRLEKPHDRSWSEAAVQNSDGAMDKSRAVHCIARQATTGGHVAAGRADGSITIHRVDTCSQVASLPAKARDDAVTSVCWLPPKLQQSGQLPVLLTSSASGLVCVYEAGKGGEPAEARWKRAAEWQCGSSIDCCQLHPSGDRFAAGGQGREVSIYDAESGARLVSCNERVCCDGIRPCLLRYTACFSQVLACDHNKTSSVERWGSCTLA